MYDGFMAVDTTTDNIIYEGGSTNSYALRATESGGGVIDMTFGDDNTNTIIAGSSVVINNGVTADSYKLSALNTAPTSKTMVGTAGDIRVTASYIYVCTLTGIEGAANWKRVALDDTPW